VGKYKRIIDANRVGDATFLQADNRAQLLLKSALPGAISKDRIQAEKLYRTMLIDEKDPVKAAMKAIQQVDPGNPLFKKQKRDPKKLSDELDNLSKELAGGMASPERKLAIKNRIQEIIREANAAKNGAEMPEGEK
jgi:hypothetical protein